VPGSSARIAQIQVGRVADVRCPECKAALSLEAPRGHRWASEAAAAFSAGYGRRWEVRRARLRTGHLQ